MAKDIKTKLSTILLALRDRIIERKVFPAERCFLSLRMNVPFHAQADSYCILLPLAQVVDVDNFDGGSRYNALIHGRINTYVRTRLALDQAYQDHHSLTDVSAGLLDRLHLLYDALYSFDCVQASGDTILEEPMRLVLANEPRKDYDNPEWLEAMAEWEISYRLDLSISTADQ
ncbi:MAG: hypothetical protein ACRDHG_13710 [Anaerolineales bacterium]